MFARARCTYAALLAFVLILMTAALVAAQPEKTRTPKPAASGETVGLPPGVPPPFYPHGMDETAPPTTEDWNKQAQKVFDEWTREKKATDCGCTYKHEVIGPTTVSKARWKPPTPQWKSAKGVSLAELNHELPNGKFIGLPSFNPVTTVYLYRKGTLVITDYRVYTLELSVKCTGKEPECPKPQILKYRYETGTSERSVETLEGCYATGLEATGGASIDEDKIKAVVAKMNQNPSDEPNPEFVSPTLTQPPQDTPMKRCL